MAKRQYPFLSFRAGTDWRKVNSVLLARMNRLGRYIGKVIMITSAARTRQGNTGATGSHHVPENNPSGMGEAVDAYIGDKQIGELVKESTFRRFGLYSGNRPGFYKGKPDPMHVETLERRGEKYDGSDAMPEAPAVPPAAPETAAPVPAVDGDTPPSFSFPQGPSPPGAPVPGVALAMPGDFSVPYEPEEIEETWRLLAADPFASPETRQLAGRLK